MKKIPETNLNDLIQRIKREGIEEASKKSNDILKEAKTNASRIIERAKEEASTIIDDAGIEIKNSENISNKAIEQALRDAILTVRQSIVEMFDSLIETECKDALSGNTFETILLKIIDGWLENKEDVLNLDIFLSESDKNMLFENLLVKYKDKIKGGINFKVHPRIEAGFRIGIKNENFYYDFTDESIAHILSEYINPKLRNLLDSIIEKNAKCK